MWHSVFRARKATSSRNTLPKVLKPSGGILHALTLSRSDSLTLFFCLALAWAARAHGEGEGSGLRFEVDAARRERAYATASARRVAADALRAAKAEADQAARTEARVPTDAFKDESPIYRDRRLAKKGIPPPAEEPALPKRPSGAARPAPGPLSPLGRLSAEERLYAEALRVAQERVAEAKGRGERYMKQLSWAQLWSKEAEAQREVRDRHLREEIARSVLRLAEEMEREAAGGEAEGKR